MDIVKSDVNHNHQEANLEDILFYRGSIDYLISERSYEIEGTQELRTCIRLLVNDCIESSLYYSDVSKDDIEKLNHLLR